MKHVVEYDVYLNILLVVSNDVTKPYTYIYIYIYIYMDIYIYILGHGSYDIWDYKYLCFRYSFELRFLIIDETKQTLKKPTKI